MNSVNNGSEWHANGTLALALPCLILPVPFWGDFEIPFVLIEKIFESHQVLDFELILTDLVPGSKSNVTRHEKRRMALVLYSDILKVFTKQNLTNWV